MIVSMTVLPSDGGNPVMKSTAICDQGRLGMGKGRSRPAGGQWEALLLAQQSRQPRTHEFPWPPEAMAKKDEDSVGSRMSPLKGL